MPYQTIREVYNCRLETLSPIHVGSGDTLRKDFDFFVRNGKVLMLSAARLFQEVERLGPEKIDEFTRAVEENGTDEWLRRQGIRVEKISTATFKIPGTKNPSEIRAQIRDGFGSPYLPGSSVKGAFRTAIIRKLACDENTRPQNRDRTDKTICGKLLGRDAKMNLMRCLSVGDFKQSSSSDFGLSKALVYRLEKRDTPEIFPKKIGKPGQKYNMEICIENLSTGSICNGTISIDRFLPSSDQEKKCFKFKAHLDLAWIIAACRALAGHTIETELAFFANKSGKPVKKIVEFYEQLRQEQKKLEDNEAIIQMAWGAGWRGMTGQLLEAEDLTPELRGRLKLAPKYKEDFPFPKSRRIVSVNGNDLPMGWARISFLSKEELRQREREEQEQVISRKHKEERELKEAAAVNMAQELENFRKRVASCANLPGEIDSFIQQVKQKKDAAIRIEMCNALLAKGDALGKKKKFSKALKDSKKWAVKLKALLDTNGISISL